MTTSDRPFAGDLEVFERYEFTTCWWKECPENIYEDRKYSVDEKNPRIVTKIDKYGCSTVIGNTPLPLNKVTSWSIKILKSYWDDGRGIYIGVAPPDINKNEDYNWNKCGWYFNCCWSSLYSGPPHNYGDKEYGPRKEWGEYVHTGDSVGVVMDTAKGELSFVLNGVNLGVAYEGIPLDKPLVPCVLLKYYGDSVELDTSEVKETAVNNPIPVPSNIVTKSVTWDSITLTWNVVEGASSYQIEVNGEKSPRLSTTNIFTQGGFPPDTEHTFRVRTVRGNAVSEWSNSVKWRTLEESLPYGGAWKECPDDVYEIKKYSVDKNPRIATFIGDELCTIIGNTPLPLNKVTSWSIKVLKSKYNNGDDIDIGVAPSDINQNEDNYEKCGWYFCCYYSTLWSGPPHNYRGKEYGPGKTKDDDDDDDAAYVHTGDSVGVVMDTTKGELSFVVNGVNYGVAYEGIPLDKPLIPCVVLWTCGDSIELDTSEVKETVDDSIPVPSNITAKSTTWDSITLTWDGVEGASFYQIEVDGSVQQLFSKKVFAKRGFLPETEHTFRVRAVKGNLVSEWSGAVKDKTEKESFETSGWKECPDNVDEYMKYSIDKENPRIATKGGDDWGLDLFDSYGSADYCTIIGNTSLPLNKVTSWNIKILETNQDDGKDIYVGVAPSDIDQNVCNYNNRGWYFDCCSSSLYSGPPHNYDDKEYGPRKNLGEYVHTGDSVGVVMDTTKGELSFVLDGVDYGVAYEGIPLDKPLVPCVLLWTGGDSVELAI